MLELSLRKEIKSNGIQALMKRLQYCNKGDVDLFNLNSLVNNILTIVNIIVENINNCMIIAFSIEIYICYHNHIIFFIFIALTINIHHCYVMLCYIIILIIIIKTVIILLFIAAIILLK